jgi:hypothetical protein
MINRMSQPVHSSTLRKPSPYHTKSRQCRRLAKSLAFSCSYSYSAEGGTRTRFRCIMPEHENSASEISYRDRLLVTSLAYASGCDMDVSLAYASGWDMDVSLTNVSGWDGRRSRRGVTVIEVLFALFVILVGLLGLAMMLPMATRQADDSYNLTHGVVSSQNTVERIRSSEFGNPSISQPWWVPDDYAQDPFTGNTNARFYRQATSFRDLYQYWQVRELYDRYGLVAGAGATPEQLVRAQREALSYGFCLDPLFCASEFEEGWIYAAGYSHLRGSATQGVFRRTRFPFFDEQLNLATGGNTFTTAAANNFPRLIRVSFSSGLKTVGGITMPLPMSRETAMQLVSSNSDVLQATAQKDKSFGALRGFQSDSDGLLSSTDDLGRISWMMTMVPSEEDEPGKLPTTYVQNTVIFSNRGTSFGAAPLAVTGDEKFSRAERVCFATANSLNNATSGPFYTAPQDLPVTKSGTMSLKLWSDQLTVSSIRVNDWVLLSRRIVLNDLVDTNTGLLVEPNRYKVIQRHRWYRVTGVDGRETWPRTIRVAGETWDYPEAIDRLNNNAVNFRSLSSFASAATTVTIVPHVVSVQRRVVRVED